jgi:hypothetical protein
LAQGRDRDPWDHPAADLDPPPIVGLGPTPELHKDGATAPPPFRRWFRFALVAGWAVATVAMGAGAALSFESLCVTLTERPTPRGDLAPIPNPLEPSRDSLALRAASQLMGRGDWDGAVRVIDTISPEEPSYPLARQLRAQAERRLVAGEGER